MLIHPKGHACPKRRTALMKPSFKVGLVCLAAAVVVYGGYWAFSEASLANFNPKPIPPGKVTFVALNLEDDYGIRVANATAQLVQLPPGSKKFEAPRAEDSGQEARRIPIRELLESLQGNQRSLVYLLSVLNKIDLDEIQPGMKHWTEEDLRRAIQGDPGLRNELESDLNVKLDGTPLDQVKMSAILNGIVIDLPLKVKVNVGEEERLMTPVVPIQYRPRFAKDVADEYNKRFNPPREFVIGNYQTWAKKVFDGESSREDVKASLEQILSDVNKTRLSEPAEQLLARAHVLINDNQVVGASSMEAKDDKGKDVITLQIKLTDEGRKRLWKYSRNQKDFALLVVVDGVAISAPRVTTELSESTVNLTGLREKRLVDDTIKSIEGLKGSN